MEHGRFLAALACAFCCALPSAFAQLPTAQISSVFPPGGKQGSAVEVSVAGTDLDELEKLVFNHPGLSAAQKMTAATELQPKPQPVPNQFVVKIAADVPPGIYEVRAAGRSCHGRARVRIAIAVLSIGWGVIALPVRAQDGGPLILRVDPTSWVPEVLIRVSSDERPRLHDVAFDEKGDIWVVTGNNSTSYAAGKAGLNKYDGRTGEPLMTVELEPGSCDPHGLVWHDGRLVSCDAGIHPGWKGMESPHTGYIFSIEML